MSFIVISNKFSQFFCYVIIKLYIIIVLNYRFIVLDLNPVVKLAGNWGLQLPKL